MPRPALRAFPRLVVRRFGGWTACWRRRGDTGVPAGLEATL